MVRAAASGIIDYTRADPRDRKWRIKHLLLLTELDRRQDNELITRLHTHWLALLSHGNLTEDSFKDAKKKAGELLLEIQRNVTPWSAPKKEAESADKTDTIFDDETSKLIERYKERYGGS